VDPANKANYRGTKVVLHWDGSSAYTEVWDSHVGGLNWKSDTWPLKPGFNQGCAVLFVPVNSKGELLPYDQCDSVYVVVTDQAEQDAPKPTGCTATAVYPYDKSKGYFFGFTGAIVDPADKSNYRGTKVVLHWDGSSAYTEVWDSHVGGLNWKSDTWPLEPGFSQGVTVHFVPVNLKGELLPYAQCDSVYIVVSDQVKQPGAAPPAGNTAHAAYEQLNGEWYFYWAGTCIDPADVSNYTGYRPYVAWAGDNSGPNNTQRYIRICDIVPKGGGTWRSGPHWKLADNFNQGVTFYLVPLNLRGEEPSTPYTQAPCLAITGGRVATVDATPTGKSVIDPGRLDTTKLANGLQVSSGSLAVKIDAAKGMTFDGSGNLIVNIDATDFKFISGYLKQNNIDLSKATNFNTDEFQVVSGAFYQKAISAEKMTLGSVLRVGYYGSTPKPGQIAIYGASETLIGWIGQNGIYFGGWFGQLYIGGSGPASAKLVADASGNLSINGATITISSTTGTVTMDSNYGFRVVYGSQWARLDNANVAVGSGTSHTDITPASVRVWDESSSASGLLKQTGSLASCSFSYGSYTGSIGITSTGSFVNVNSVQIGGTTVIDSTRTLSNVTLPAHSHASDSWFTGHTTHPSIIVGSTTVIDASLNIGSRSSAHLIPRALSAQPSSGMTTGELAFWYVSAGRLTVYDGAHYFDFYADAMR
jgi:hypothetical protein